MTSYAALKAQAEKYMKEAEVLLEKEIKAAITQIKKTIATYGLTAKDLGLTGKVKSAKSSGRGRPASKSAAKKKPGRPAKAKAGSKKAGSKKVGSKKTAGSNNKDGRSMVAPKYRDPATGITWTGRGKQPKWLSSAIKSGKKLDHFKI
jgi:DNA-binding protein H-NS